mmetsp:Transcript_49287/g.114237  ORF Transcript_49287/g.114237 Transcript_49287/m.114237 type:complete len:188 (-) Transcript_49287:138-701(-)
MLRELLDGAGLSPAPAAGPTLIVQNCSCVLDHVWAGDALKPRAMLGSPAKALRALEAIGLPTAEHPSDHLPVAALYRVERSNISLSSLQPPANVEEALRDEWLAIIWSSPCSNAGKGACREQRRLEGAFLGAIEPEAAQSLQLWRAAAVDAAKRVVKVAAFSSVSALHVAKPPDPGGGMPGTRLAGG